MSKVSLQEAVWRDWKRVRRFELAESKDGWPSRSIPENWAGRLPLAQGEGLNFLANFTAVHFLDDSEMHLVAHVYRIDEAQAADGQSPRLKVKLPDR